MVVEEMGWWFVLVERSGVVVCGGGEGWGGNLWW